MPFHDEVLGRQLTSGLMPHSPRFVSASYPTNTSNDVHTTTAAANYVTLEPLLPPRADVFPANAPHLEAINTRHRREEPPKYPGELYRHPDGFVPAQVRHLPIRPVPMAGKVPRPVPPQLRPGSNPYPDRRSSRLANISTKSSPELRRSMHRQDVRSGTTSVATVRNGPAHGQPEFRPISTYDSIPAPFAQAQRARTSSNPTPAQRPSSSSSSSIGGAWCSSSPEVPNFSRKIPVKASTSSAAATGASNASPSTSPVPSSAASTSRPSIGTSPPRIYKPTTSSPLSRPGSIADMQKGILSHIRSSAPRMPALNRPPSSASIVRAEDAWRSAANVPAFSRNALKDNTIIMPLKASDMKKSREKEQNLKRLKRGSKSTADLRSSGQAGQTSPRKSRLVVTNPDVIDIARKIPFERPPSCLRNSVSSSHSPQQSKVPKKVRIADDPVPQLPAAQLDSDSLIDFKASFDNFSGSIESSFHPPPRASSIIATPKYVRRRSNSMPNASAMMQKKEMPKMSDWLESSSDELKKFLCPSPSPPSISPASSPPRPREAAVAEKKISAPPKPVPLLRFSKSGGDLKVEFNKPSAPTLPKLDTHLRSESSGPPHRPRLPSPIFSTFSMERANSGVTTSSSSSNDTCSTDRSLATTASSKTSIETPPSIFKPSSTKPPEKTVQLPPPPKSSADLWRQIDDDVKVQQPRTVIPQAPAKKPLADERRKDNKPENRPTLMTKLVSGLGFGSRKSSESKRVRCNCGTTTVNLHYKKYHTSNGDGAGLL